MTIHLSYIIIGFLAFVSILLTVLIMKSSGKNDEGFITRISDLEKALERQERMTRDELVRSREELNRLSGDQRNEMIERFRSFGDSILKQLMDMTDVQKKQLSEGRLESAEGSKRLREEVVNMVKTMSGTLSSAMNDLALAQKNQLDAVAAAISKLTESNEKKLETVRSSVETRLQTMQADNARHLELMRQTVDEKLQGTLEKRLGESFKQVSERLEMVHKGLGEMQTLATGVGDLKKVLTNVKTRGTWGEVQLGTLLEQVLTSEQYAVNVATRDGGERVEFAIKLPGNTDSDEIVWLPIDAKFPVEDYQRLLDAQECGDLIGVEQSMKQLDLRVKASASDISGKYLNPPKTTDFGILFLPVEGLYAEVIRRTGLIETIQREFRVVIAGPTTLWSILSSLQMGFRTLAIQKRSSEVWSLLGAVKTEWSKYGGILDQVQKKLHQASETIEKARVRSRAVGRKLRDVQEVPTGDHHLLMEPDNMYDETSEYTSMDEIV